MKHFNTSLFLGVLTILVWVLASIKFNEPKELITDKEIVENIEKSLSETLTIDYKEATN